MSDIIILKDIHLPDGYLYKAMDVYLNTEKCIDKYGSVYYEPIKGHIITDKDSVMELGAVTSEIFSRLEKIGKIEDIEYILESILKIEELETKVTNLQNSINSLTEQINELKAREEN